MRQYEICVTAEFSAAHQLRMYDGTLESLHGHNWKVEATLRGPALDRIGVLADFNVVRERLNQTVARWHDRFLNEMPEFREKNPSAEHVAEHLFDALWRDLPAGVRLHRVRVWETSGCSAACIDDEDTSDTPAD